jgi:hypothetical protein
LQLVLRKARKVLGRKEKLLNQSQNLNHKNQLDPHHQNLVQKNGHLLI